MSLARRTSNRFNTAIWPGFVDAMTALLLVLTFVLSIFMIMQFLLQETISDQELELDELGTDLAALANSLGLERARNSTLEANLGAARDALSAVEERANSQSQLIATLSLRIEQQQDQLNLSQSAISNFEAQVAALLLERDEAIALGTGLRDTNAALSARQAELETERDRLSQALAASRTELDAQQEAARLAAARREALDAMIADMQAQAATNASEMDLLNRELTDAKAKELSLVQELSAEEAARLAESAAADALRRRLAEADTELTAMTLALEQKRKEAEETLTLLAAARAAESDLNARLAAAVLEGETLSARLGAASEDGAAAVEEIERLEAALAVSSVERTRLSALTEDLQAQIAALQADRTALQSTAETTGESLAARQAELAELAARLSDLTETNASLAQQFSELQSRAGAETSAMSAQITDLRTTVARLEGENAALRTATQDTATVREQLTAALAAKLAAEADQTRTLSVAEERALLLAEANRQLAEQEARSAEDQRRLALLNEQVSALRIQLGALQGVLDAAAESDAEANVQIDALGNQLNAALARVATEERKRAELEERERKRLEAEAEALKSETRALASYRSEFFGRLREILGNQEGVRIVGDRFVFSSEVLFSQGSAELSEAGQFEIAKIAALLRSVADDIPPEIDWIIRVDGHTDNVPLSGLGEFADNWELSQARALSVVRYMQDTQGLPPNRLAANGFGEYQPIATGNSAQARAQNRRIELKLTEK